MKFGEEQQKSIFCELLGYSLHVEFKNVFPSRTLRQDALEILIASVES